MGSADANRKKRANQNAAARDAMANGPLHDGPPVSVAVRERSPAQHLADVNAKRAEAGLPALTVTAQDVQDARDRLDRARAAAAVVERSRAAQSARTAELRDAGMRRAEVNASSWNLLADEAIRRCATLLDRFDADDVWDPELGNLDTTVENRALGPAFRRAHKAGIAEPTKDFRQSRQPQCHGMPRRVWRSLLRGES